MNSKQAPLQLKQEDPISSKASTKPSIDQPKDNEAWTPLEFTAYYK